MYVESGERHADPTTDSAHRLGPTARARAIHDAMVNTVAASHPASQDTMR